MKRVLALILALVMLAACAGVGGGAADDSAAAPAAPAPGAGAAAAPADGEDLPVLRILMPFHSFDMMEDPMTPALRYITGYDFIIENLPSENPLAALNTIIAAREEFDMIQLMTDMFRNTVTLGAFQPLDDLLDAYAPNMVRVVDPNAWRFVTLNNEIMGVPEIINEGQFVFHVMRVRKDMMQEVGIYEVPTTLTGFYDMLVALRDGLDVIPLSYAPQMGAGVLISPFISSAFGVEGNWNYYNGRLVHAVEHPGMRDYIAFMNQLFVEGLLDDEFPTLTTSVANEKWFSGRSAIHTSSPPDRPHHEQVLWETFPDAVIAQIPPLEHNGVSGRQLNDGLARAMVLPRVSRNHEHSLRFMDLTQAGANHENFTYLNIGVEGIHWYFDENGIRTPVDPTFQEERGRAAQFNFGVPTPFARQVWVEVRTRRIMPIFYELFEVTNQTYDMVPVSINPLAFMPPIQEFLDNIVMANEFASENLLLFICNIRPLDEWDDFVEEWRTFYGGDIVTQALNQWWEAERDVVRPIMLNPVNPFDIFDVRP